MSKGARTVGELEKAVALLRTRDSARAREIRAVRAEISAIEQMLDRQFSPAANSTATPCGSDAGTAPPSARNFWRRLFSWRQ